MQKQKKIAQVGNKRVAKKREKWREEWGRSNKKMEINDEE